MSEIRERKEKHERFICDTLGIGLKIREIEYKDKDAIKRQDCTTRAMSTVLDIPFIEVLKKQLSLAIEFEQTHSGYIKISEKILKEYGFNRMKISLSEHISVGEFMYKRKTGKYVIVAGGHMIAYMDGVWYDNEGCFSKADTFLVQYVAFAFTNQKIKEKELLINKNDYMEVKEHERKNSIKKMDREL